MAKSKSGYKTIRVKVPSPVKKRYEWVDNRTLLIDFRGVSRAYKNRKFQSPAQLEAQCNQYFASCYGVLRNNKGDILYDEAGQPVMGQIKPFTVSGLARHLGIATSTLRKYGLGLKDLNGFGREDVEDYSDVVRAAKQRIEEYAEGRLYDKDGYNGARFVLDNAFNWLSQKEQAEIEHLRKTDSLKEKEYELKKDMLEGANTDEPFTITVRRAEKPE